jgi:hypothetical protein
MSKYNAIKIIKAAAAGVTGPYGGYKSKQTSVGGVPTFRGPNAPPATGTVRTNVGGVPTFRGKGAPGPTGTFRTNRGGVPTFVGVKAQQDIARRQAARMRTSAPKIGQPVAGRQHIPGQPPAQVAPPKPAQQVAPYATGMTAQEDAASGYSTPKSRVAPQDVLTNPYSKQTIDLTPPPQTAKETAQAAPKNPAPAAVPKQPELSKSRNPVDRAGYTPEMVQKYKQMEAAGAAGDKELANSMAKEFSNMYAGWISDNPSEQAIQAHKEQADTDLKGVGDRLGGGNFLGGDAFKKRIGEIGQAGLAGQKAKNSLKPYESAYLKKFMQKMRSGK